MQLLESLEAGGEIFRGKVLEKWINKLMAPFSSILSVVFVICLASWTWLNATHSRAVFDFSVFQKNGKTGVPGSGLDRFLEPFWRQVGPGWAPFGCLGCHRGELLTPPFLEGFSGRRPNSNRVEK